MNRQNVQKTRRTLTGWQNGKCFYCGRQMVSPTIHNQKDDRRATLDHVIPVSAGGDESFENLVAACQACNTKKGDIVVVAENPKAALKAVFAEGPR